MGGTTTFTLSSSLTPGVHSITLIAKATTKKEAKNPVEDPAEAETPVAETAEPPAEEELPDVSAEEELLNEEELPAEEELLNEEELLEEIDTKYPEIPETIRTTKVLDEATEKKLIDAIVKFKEQFK